MKLDVRTKLLLLVLANLTFLLRTHSFILLMIGSVMTVFLFLMGSQKTAKHYAEALLFIVLTSFFWDKLPLFMVRPISIFIVVATYILPCCIAASILIKTTSAYELVHGLRKLHFPETVLLTFAVMLRFLPSIKEETRIIHQSLKVRSIFLHKRDILFHPKSYFEFLLVPLLMSLLRKSRDLTLSTLTKGLAIKNQSTNYYQSSFSWKDWGVQIWILVTIIMMLTFS
ncbi:hypothetical protein HMPREF9318_00294 [Streptococcus urinalis FB127-CNA-2]|uniref:Cobalt transport protein n=1 Tax=Streptococcus urinalis 2285-97 TaxID=764291 RepID=G5KFN4_9STRE|nr:energy-coupling factor transporter transmembrane component T [Streptococcus urinalis]EHJ55686.1 cobalt transport protein [Streptococcus urinalis 2285-97]EKS22096.1 hypothetical protein HMPREF9318_00294 [Streptococcus urinalis FB127-CNA-2]VEF31908.1 membrane protein [Streptococcus urinalis]